MKTEAWIGVFLAASLVAAPAAGADEKATVSVGITNVIADVGLFVADARGYFADANIKVNFIGFDAAARMIAPFASGELDVGGGGISAGLFNAVARGVGIRIVADKSTSAAGLSTGALVVRKQLADTGAYRGPADLKGRRIAVPAPGTGTSTSLERYFRTSGFGISDVTLVYMSFPLMVTALDNGAVDAAFVAEPMLTRVVSDGTALLIAPDDVMFPNHEIAVTLFSEPFIRNRRGVAVDFMKAFLRGTRDYNDVIRNGRLAGPGADDVISILTRYSLVKDPAVYRRIGVHSCDPDGRVNLDSLGTDLAYFKSAGLIERPVELAAAVDSSIAQAAVQTLGPYTHRETTAPARGAAQ